MRKHVLSSVARLAARLGAFRSDAAGATAIEFSLIGLVFFTVFLGIIQFALVFMAQMYLHDAVSEAATGRTAGTYAGNRAQVVTQICARLIAIEDCSANLLVENQPLANYPTTAQPIAGAVFAVPAVRTPMLIRARAPVVTFVPGLPALQVRAAAVYARLQ